MLKSVEHKGYVVQGFSKPWSALLWIGGYIITAQRGGKPVREYREAAMRDSADRACDAAVTCGMHYVDLMLLAA